MADDLHITRLRWVRTELDQIGVAVSVVGTRRPMLLKLAGYLEPVIEGLRGERPDVRKTREDLIRVRHNLRTGPTTPLRASRNLWKARDLMDQVIRLRDKGLLDIASEVEEGRLTLENAWGYTPPELRVFLAVLRDVAVDLSDVGLYRRLIYGVVRLDPDVAKGFASYDDQRDVIIVNPARGKSKVDLFEAFGDRMWSRLFISTDRQTWGTRSRFLSAFVRAVRGKPLNSDERARLQVTVGRIAGDDWRNVAA